MRRYRLETLDRHELMRVLNLFNKDSPKLSKDTLRILKMNYEVNLIPDVTS